MYMFEFDIHLRPQCPLLRRMEDRTPHLLLQLPHHPHHLLLRHPHQLHFRLFSVFWIRLFFPIEKNKMPRLKDECVILMIFFNLYHFFAEITCNFLHIPHLQYNNDNMCIINY